ncbi:MAG: hypothetical protein KC506_01515 [Nanoarchaeota archaeon]|nr:hypothetical protein [Nanoarchaeota archaeon]
MNYEDTAQVAYKALNLATREVDEFNRGNRPYLTIDHIRTGMTSTHPDYHEAIQQALEYSCKIQVEGQRRLIEGLSAQLKVL